MRNKFSNPYYSSSSFTSYGSHHTVQLREIALDLLEAVRMGGHKGNLLSLYGDLVNALDNIWMRASDGLLEVESLAILRAMKSVTCPDLRDQLIRPNVDYRKLTMNLRLFINTIDHLLIPKRSRMGSRSRAY